ncbi:hypothetical protein FIBSPDRAFT_552843 [Athelia psychrophila]|uniref:Uncharacterized protein n=1 Tax=Athelia psychrophila TaxID=1759441 RepID=A0A166UYC3_9AGAM|nr:hypothetical protein FIBSPDRAFT_552843 [Fibularhizoctonia sp. CBS 109695]
MKPSAIIYHLILINLVTVGYSYLPIRSFLHCPYLPIRHLPGHGRQIFLLNHSPPSGRDWWRSRSRA